MKDILTKIDTYFTSSLIETIFSALLLYLCGKIIQKIADRYLKRKAVKNAQFIHKIIGYIINIIVILCICYQIKSLESITKSILASGGIVAVVLGLAAQEAFGNLVSGLMILFFKPFSIGDLIKVNEISGTVSDISLRHTVITTFENTKIIIPNSQMNQSTLENISLAELKNNFLYLTISYESSIEKAMEIIKEEVLKHPLYIDDGNEIVVYCSNLLDSSVELKTSFRTQTNIDGIQMSSDLRISIKQRFEESGINIPYPHLTISK